MKETSRRRIMVASSLNEISTDRLGNMVVVKGGGGGLRSCSNRRDPFQQQVSGRYLKTT
jgi:hypothetical protein